MLDEDDILLPDEQFDRTYKFSSQQRQAIDTIQQESQLQGKDIQKIGWEISIRRTRSNYRMERLKSYDTYRIQNEDESKPLGELIDMLQNNELKFSKTDCNCFYKFKLNSRQTSCGFTHFQLRHLLFSLSPNDVYYMSNYGIHHWNNKNITTLQSDGKYGIDKRVMDLRVGYGIIKDVNYLQQQNIKGISISTINGNFPYIVAGGFKGEIIIKNIENENIIYNNRITFENNSIVNYIDFSKNSNNLLIANNDGYIRYYDLPTMDIISHKKFNYCINNSVLQKTINGNLIIAIGDAHDVIVYDKITNKEVFTLKGHFDYSFAADWNPIKEYQFATGSQDRTTCIWDLRMPNKAYCKLPAILGAIRSVHYSEDGRFLCSAEPADFLHLYDVESNFEREQQLDVFGEIVGVSFSKGDGGKSLFVGMYDRQYKSVMEFNRFVPSNCLDEMLI
ncbi:hypothetical protein ABK040_016686 [Willaertia magna]